MQLQRTVLTCLVTITLSACNFLTPRDQDSSITAPHPDSIIGHSVKKTNTKSTSPVISDDDIVSAVDGMAVDDKAIVESESDDVWQRIRQDLTIPRHTENGSVKSKIAWYAGKQEFLDRVADRATPYIYHIIGELEKRNMPLELALLPIGERAYQPLAHSPSRASGIWQFIASTGKRYGLKQNWWYDGRRDIVASTDAALNYLQTLHDMFDGNWLHALAAYNAGELNVARAIQRNQKAGKPTDFWSLQLPGETRGYIPSLLAVAEIVANHAKYKITLKAIPNKPYFAVIKIDSQIDLATAARLAGVGMDQITALNPGFTRWATDPDGPHHLLVPIENVQQFEQKLAALPASERMTWRQHQVKGGETLGQIARHYNTSVSALKQINHLQGNLIRVGQSLMVTAAGQPVDLDIPDTDSEKLKGLKTSGDGNKAIYTVRSGDNLWDISRNHGASVTQLCNWNGISKNTILRPGQKLTVWIKDDENTSSEGFIPVAANVEQTTGDVNPNQQIEYTVREGDSLWLISRRFNVSVAQLCQWNQIPKGRILQPGQNLIIMMEV